MRSFLKPTVLPLEMLWEMASRFISWAAMPVAAMFRERNMGCELAGLVPAEVGWSSCAVGGWAVGQLGSKTDGAQNETFSASKAERSQRQGVGSGRVAGHAAA